MAEQMADRSLDDVCTEVCTRLDGETYVVNPSISLLHALVEWGVQHPESFGPMRILCEERTLKEALSAFLVASQTADLIESDRLELRTHRDPPKSSLAIDGSRLLVLIDAGDCAGALSSTDPAFVHQLHDACAAAFEESDRFLLHTPAMSRIESTLVARLGPDRWADFASLTDAATFTDTVDEVIISLLVAAKHRDLLYDISKWGEDIGLASKATFSRKKTDLEECHLITTDSEPIDVGRPRLRLRLAEPALESGTPSEIVAETHRRLR